MPASSPSPFTAPSRAKGPGLAQGKTLRVVLGLALCWLSLSQAACHGDGASTSSSTETSATSGDTGSTGGTATSSSTGGTGSSTASPGVKSFNDSFAVLDQDGGSAQIGSTSLYVEVHAEADGQHQSFRLGAPDGTLVYQIILGRDGQRQASGSHAQNGVVDFTETTTPSPGFVRIVAVSDTNRDGIEDHRLTRVLDLTQRTLTSTAEELDFVDGGDTAEWVTSAQSTGPLDQHVAPEDDPASPECNALKNAPTSPVGASALPGKQEHFKVSNDPNVGCTQTEVERLDAALSDALDHGMKCLGDMDPYLVSDLWIQIGKHGVLISCGNRCPKVLGQTDEPDTRPPGEVIRMNLDLHTTASSTAQQLEALLLHELDHAAGRTHFKKEGKDDPNDSIYSCGRFCSSCLVQDPDLVARDCASCATTQTAQELYCGLTRKVVTGPPPLYKKTIACSEGVIGRTACIHELWELAFTCDGAYAPTADKTYLCCDECPDVSYSLDVCDNAPAVDTVTSNNCDKVKCPYLP